MNYFLDTEFTQLPWVGESELISIGLVNENGDEYYACLNNFDSENTSEFVQETVLPKLPAKPDRKPPSMVKKEIYDFIDTKQGVDGFWCLYPTEEELHQWGFNEDETGEAMNTYGDIDLQFVQQLLGDMYANSWPDSGSNLVPLVKKLEQTNQLPDNDQVHNALADAQWNRLVWLKARRVLF